MPPLCFDENIWLRKLEIKNESWSCTITSAFIHEKLISKAPLTREFGSHIDFTLPLHASSELNFNAQLLHLAYGTELPPANRVLIGPCNLRVVYAVHIVCLDTDTWHYS
jgi:hypothetical protein